MIITVSNHRIAIDDLCKSLIECCLKASTITIPQTTFGITKEIPGWNDLAKQEREQSLFWHWILCECGKPYNGDIYNIMKKTRHTYHYTVRRLKRNKTQAIKLKLAEKSNDSTSFWQEIKKLNPNNSILPDIVDNANTDEDITNVFKEKYKEIYTSVPTDDMELETISQDINNLVLTSSNNDSCYITPSIVMSCITNLKSSKSDGDTGFNSNHLIHGTHRLYTMLCLLFNSMLTHGYYPKELVKSTIISIPKDKSISLSKSTNYRGISLFNSINKLFDYVIIDLCGDTLLTSEMQFGLKPKHSTTLCTTVLKEIINYYVRRNSNIYCCFLDASKAFDKIHFGKLFKTLISKKVPPLVIRLIFNSYIRQEARVSWGSHFSCYFHLRNGVKQGGVISAQLFTVYIDKLLLDLKHSGYGCHLGDTFTGVLSYADDITLICPSLRGMNCMLKICSDFAENFSLTFNSNKSMCIKFGESVNDREKIMLNNLQIAWVNDVRHLGNYINKSLSDKLDCQKKVSTFIGSVNKLNANFRNLQHDVIARLFKSHCCSFYGSQAWRIDSPDYKRICISWNKSVRNILRLPHTTHTWILGPLLGQPHIHCQLQQRTLRFLCSTQNNNNILVSACWKYASNNANSPLGYNIAYFRNSYGIDIFPDVNRACVLNVHTIRHLMC